MKKPTLVDRLMAEMIPVFGYAMTRAEAYRLLLSVYGDKRCADMMAFGDRTTVTLPDGYRPWTAEEVAEKIAIQCHDRAE